MAKSPGTVFVYLAAFAAALAAATPAQAITFATGQGTDSATCGGANSPCRTLQQAVTNTPAGGYVLLRGPADFGGAEVQKSLSIVGEGGATIRATPTGIGRWGVLIYNDPNAIVRLRGLTIEGGGVGTTGVDWINGKRLEIADCVIRNFPTLGAQISAPNGSFSIINSTVAGSGLQGVRVVTASGSLNGEIDALRLYNNVGGLSVEYAGAPQPRVVVKNSVASGNRGFNAAGFAVSGRPDSLLILQNSISSDNPFGLRSTSGEGGELWIRGATITGNTTALDGVRSFGGNVVRGNGDDRLDRILPAQLH